MQNSKSITVQRMQISNILQNRGQGQGQKLGTKHGGNGGKGKGKTINYYLSGETQLEDGGSNGDLSLKQNALLLSASAISYFFKVWSKYAPIVSDKVEHST